MTGFCAPGGTGVHRFSRFLLASIFGNYYKWVGHFTVNFSFTPAFKHVMAKKTIAARVEPTDVDRIGAWRRPRDMTESEAMRRLMQKGLEVEESRLLGVDRTYAWLIWNAVNTILLVFLLGSNL